MEIFTTITFCDSDRSTSVISKIICKWVPQEEERRPWLMPACFNRFGESNGAFQVSCWFPTKQRSVFVKLILAHPTPPPPKWIVNINQGSLSNRSIYFYFLIWPIHFPVKTCVKTSFKLLVLAEKRDYMTIKQFRSSAIDWMRKNKRSWNVAQSHLESKRHTTIINLESANRNRPSSISYN